MPLSTSTFIKSVAANFVAVLVGLLLALSVLEASARALSSVLGLTSYMRYDAEIGWVASPNAVKRHKDTREGFDVTYHINVNGLRGPVRQRPKLPGVRRIVLVGDSNGFGWGVQDSAHLASLLESASERTEVVNLSLSGYGTDQELLRLRRDGPTYQPNVIILQVTLNDLEEIQHPFFNQKAKPQFVLSESEELLLQNVPVRPYGPKAEEYFRSSLPVPFQAWLDWNSYAYGYLNAKYYSIMRRYRRTSTPPQTPFPPSSIKLFNRLVAEVAGTAQKMDAIGIVVHAVPEISKGVIPLETSMVVVDLYPRFIESREHGTEPWFGDGYHWNATGHQIAARELRTALEAVTGK